VDPVRSMADCGRAVKGGAHVIARYAFRLTLVLGPVETRAAVAAARDVRAGPHRAEPRCWARRPRRRRPFRGSKFLSRFQGRRDACGPQDGVRAWPQTVLPRARGLASSVTARARTRARGDLRLGPVLEPVETPREFLSSAYSRGAISARGRDCFRRVRLRNDGTGDTFTMTEQGTRCSETSNRETDVVSAASWPSTGARVTLVGSPVRPSARVAGSSNRAPCFYWLECRRQRRRVALWGLCGITTAARLCARPG
jgi:hypothetical protein